MPLLVWTEVKFTAYWWYATANSICFIAFSKHKALELIFLQILSNFHHLSLNLCYFEPYFELFWGVNKKNIFTVFLIWNVIIGFFNIYIHQHVYISLLIFCLFTCHKDNIMHEFRFKMLMSVISFSEKTGNIAMRRKMCGCFFFSSPLHSFTNVYYFKCFNLLPVCVRETYVNQDLRQF